MISSGGKIDFSRKKEKIRKTNTKGTTGHFWPLRGKGLSPFWIQITFTPNTHYQSWAKQAYAPRTAHHGLSPLAFPFLFAPKLRRSLPRDAPQGSTTPKTLDHPRERSGAEGEPRPSQIPPGTGAATPAAMKLTVKTLKGTYFEIRVQPNDTVSRPDPHSVLIFFSLLVLRMGAPCGFEWLWSLILPICVELYGVLRDSTVRASGHCCGQGE